MKPYMSHCLLALAVLQGLMPADNCVMKLAGICSCDRPVVLASKETCCHGEDAACCSKCADHTSQKTQHNKSCCAYTPAHGLTVDAPNVPTADTNQDCAPVAILSFVELLSAYTPAGIAPHAGESPPPPDTPLYLRTHSFLI